MKKRFGSPAYSVILYVALAALLVAPSFSLLLSNFPYYNYIDEGHVLLWTESFYLEDAPFRIFYGPLQFYCITFLDALFYLFSNFSFSGLGEHLTQNSDPLFYNDLRSDQLLIYGRMLSAFSLLLSAFFVYLYARNCTDNNHYSALISLFFISQAWVLKFSVIVQPEIISLAILSGILAFLSRRDSDGHLAYRGDFSDNVKVAALFALLASTKLHLIVYSVIPMIVVYRCRGLAAFKVACPYFLILLFFTACIYLPFRSPVGILKMLIFSGDYYSGKELTQTLTAKFFSLDVVGYTQWAILLVSPLFIFKEKLNVIASALLFVFIVSFIYFSQYPFSNTRNLFAFNLVCVVLLTDYLVSISSQKFFRFQDIFVYVLFGVMIVINLSISFDDISKRKNVSDSRNASIIKNILQSNDVVVIDKKLQIYTRRNEKHLFVDRLVNKYAGEINPRFLLSSERLDDDVYEGCYLRDVLGSKEAKNAFFFIQNPKIFVYECDD